MTRLLYLPDDATVIQLEVELTPDELSAAVNAGMRPAAVLPLKHIGTSGQVMDTILNSAAGGLQTPSPPAAVLIIFVLALLIEFFIGSAGAKAALMMPILLPLADLVGVTRQLTVLAYCFGDGFSNMAYPTNFPPAGYQPARLPCCCTSHAARSIITSAGSKSAFEPATFQLKSKLLPTFQHKKRLN